ncbi:DNA alkylation repair protein [Dyadobacter sediminis]|uniref:DNA alkylation repair protein n=1 Tax=Dyadobacter sediminis TaxID=1493691 RepID=A0A5R9KFI8_9BACT|nr:DNA alkylation repair protein [Dyadobacter sediminis]TLU94826.1 DNA alkylation repair protein [Dyadobacter sediminis]GGB87635.1 DNA alkylation repair protein [Dyadobacter sediminis]
MTALKETLSQLEALGSEKMHAFNKKHGVGNNQFGVKMGDIRTLAKKIKTNHQLALELWNTGNTDARFLAILLIDPKQLSSDEISGMVKSERFTHVADWLYTYVIKLHSDNEALRIEWMQSEDPMCARAGWSLTSGCVARTPEVLDLPALLDRIETEMPNAAPEAQWTMNSTLAQIGIRFPEYRARALAIGEKLGIYRNFPVSKGCTSPFAPIWINEMVRRQELEKASENKKS